jgi:diguanylate cyclase (GGDEF)-like protein/PAS domain S-box-containing protein
MPVLAIPRDPKHRVSVRRTDSDVILERLVAAEREIESMYDAASFGSHTVGPDGTYAAINALELSWIGSTREELLGKRKPREFLTPDSQAKLDRYIDVHGRRGFVDLELELQNVRMEKRPISISFNGSISDDGTPQKGRSVSFDLTAIHFSRNLQRIAAMSFESLCGICVTDTNGSILRVNAGFTTLTGYSNPEVVGRNMHILSSGIQTAGFYDSMWQSIAALGHWQGEIRNRRKDGQIITEWLSIAAVKGADGAVTNYVGTFYDISASKVSQDEITRLALHDTLTQLPNRRLLQQRIEHALAMTGRNGLHSALLFIDLDYFKSINDTRGHEAGDMLLIEAGRRMQMALRDSDTVARVGGDEFVVLLEGMGSAMQDAATQARQIAEKLLETLAVPYRIKDFEFRCTASIGIGMVHSGESATQLLTHADLAMYQAKRHGRNSLQFFDPQMQSAATARAEMEQDMQRAISKLEFELYYQPQVDAHRQIVGLEALLRWRHPVRGLVSPAEIIPLAEETGLIVPIGKWVLETACKQMKIWQQHPSTSKLSVAVNVSAKQFSREDFVEVVLNILSSTGADPFLLDLEITESMMLDVESAVVKMQALGKVGVRFSVDDFGTGYSSLAILTRLPISKLKIDQSFVRNLGCRKKDEIIVKTIVGMAHSLGLTVIAEGVETRLQHDQLTGYECDLFQGYLFGRAQPRQDLERALEVQHADETSALEHQQF